MTDGHIQEVPPYDGELEIVVLGAILQYRDAMGEVADILYDGIFYIPAHQDIYRACRGLYDKQRPIDSLTVMDELKKLDLLEEIGGPAYLSSLTDRIASAANLEYHCRILIQLAIRRDLHSLGYNMAKKAYDRALDVFDVLDEVGENLYKITSGNIKFGYTSISESTANMVKEIDRIKEAGKDITGIPTGYAALDKLTGGWQASDLIILAARPGMGKTSLALCLAKNAADLNIPIGIFSLEMTDRQLSQRLVSMDASINLERLRRADFEPGQYQDFLESSQRVSNLPIYLDDTPGLSLFDLRTKARKMKTKHDIQMVVIDYLQLMSGGRKSGRNREQEVSEISRGLKGLAKELNVPVIALSQLSRAVEIRGGTKRPQLSDLRESGSLEQDSDMVAFIYRPEYYQILEDEDGQSLKGVAEIIVAKHRNGSLRTVKLGFIGKYTKFFDPEIVIDLPENGVSEGEDIPWYKE